MTHELENIIKEFSSEELLNFKNILEKLYNNKISKLKSSPTLFNFSKDYEEYISSTFSTKYLTSVNQSFKHLLKFFGEDKRLEGITVRDVESFKITLQRTAPKGAAIYLRTLKAAFNKELEWGNISFNPFAKIKVKKNQQLKPNFITRAELQKALNHLKDEIVKNIIIFSFNTGCRLQECISLKWSNVDLSNNYITIGDVDFSTKSKKQRIIPLSLELQKLLPELKKKAKESYRYVLCKKNGFCFHPDYISKQFKQAIRKAGLSEDIHFHTLRHSFGSNLANRGVPIIAIKEMMGHSSITTTEIYSHTNLENLQREIAKLDVA